LNRVEILSKSLDNVVARQSLAFDATLKSLGSPDKAIGKPYATFDGTQVVYNWTQQEMQILQMIYGDMLNQIIADREIKLVKQLEKAAGIL